MEYDGDEINQSSSIGIATGHLKNLAGDLAEINELASKKCGSLPGKLSKRGAYEWIFIITKTKDREIVKQQDCVLDVFLSQHNQVSEFYKGLLMISTNLENYMDCLADSWNVAIKSFIVTKDKSFKVVIVAIKSFGKLLIIKSKSIKILCCKFFQVY